MKRTVLVIMIIDCSTSMEGERIAAVNAAMDEIKETLRDISENGSLNLEVALMTFAAAAKWEIRQVPFEEAFFDKFSTRPGITYYVPVFKELNSFLDKENFRKYTGEVAPPVIVLLTDGEPEDDQRRYDKYINELCRNIWFKKADKYAVLIGDAAESDFARNAVEKFVADRGEVISVYECAKIGTSVINAINRTILSVQSSQGDNDYDAEEMDIITEISEEDDELESLNKDISSSLESYIDSVMGNDGSLEQYGLSNGNDSDADPDLSDFLTGDIGSVII